jgi:hypothetical protein
MITKAKLIVILKADDTVVAEVEDAGLWQKVLNAIHQPSDDALALLGRSEGKGKEADKDSSTRDSADPIAKLASKIGVKEEELVGAVDPSKEEPYLQLDVNSWEKMKKQLPERGPGAIAPTAVVATILCLWFKEAGLGNPTQGQVAAILKGINVIDTNTSRAISRANWLQGRSGGIIVLNPAEISRSNAIAKSFCQKKWNNKDAAE